MNSIAPEKTKLYPNEQYARNKRFYELSMQGWSYDKIAFSPEENPNQLGSARIGKIIASFKRRHATDELEEAQANGLLSKSEYENHRKKLFNLEDK